jgi:7-carboxy-7-deazaguanine synthase
MLRITEIFASLQGETSYQGLPFSFVRLTGCNLRCRYCDTAYAYEGGETLSVDEAVSRVRSLGIPRVTVTGGEPMLQAEAVDLVSALLDRDHVVLVETNGTLPLSGLDPRAVKIMDVKCPGSGEEGRMLWENFSCLSPRDEVKFVIASRDDYRYAAEVLVRYGGGKRFTALFSPAFGLIRPEEIAGWIVRDRLDVRFQIQLHKAVWGPDRRGV